MPAPADGYTFGGWTVEKTGDSTTSVEVTGLTDSTGVNNANFGMPAYAVTIKATFAEKTVENIAVKTAPTKTTYASGEHFDPTGLVITVTYSDDSKVDRAYDTDEGFTFSPDTSTALTTSNKSITIEYGTTNFWS